MSSVHVHACNKYDGVSTTLVHFCSFFLRQDCYAESHQGTSCRLQRGKVSAEALLKVSSLSSFPISLDDISSAAKSAVTFFNAVGHTTVENGTSPLGTVVFSPNKTFIESDKYDIVLKTKVSEHNYNSFIHAGMQAEQSMNPSSRQQVNYPR